MKNKVTIYGRSSCPFCVRAKNLCEDLRISFDYIDMTGDIDAQERVFELSNGMRTVPQIFIGEKHVGGFSDLEALQRSGELLSQCILKE